MKNMDNNHLEYILELYVNGESFISNRAIKSIKTVCENELINKCKLTIIDLSINPELALEENILAVPVLIRQSPLPKRQIIGDLQDYERILKGLDIG
jgi:circadian clock protein KaiB